MSVSPKTAFAAVEKAEVQIRSSYEVTIEAPMVPVYTQADETSARQTNVMRGQTYTALAAQDGGWVRIRTGGREGYIKVAGNATLVERNSETIDEDAKYRREVVEYALQFLGGKYVYGGTDPNQGADCSGFIRYIMENMASITLPHSAAQQSSYGEAVTLDEMQPGDLIFYSRGGGINHVAMYIGGGQVVHASTEKTGIKTSPYNYREPVKVVNILS